jgi:hypothetical protein
MIKPSNRQNCMPNFIIPESTVDKGVTSLGKYTFPNIAAFAVNVEDVLFKHAVKKFQMVMLAI